MCIGLSLDGTGIVSVSWMHHDCYLCALCAAKITTTPFPFPPPPPPFSLIRMLFSFGRCIMNAQKGKGRGVFDAFFACVFLLFSACDFPPSLVLCPLSLFWSVGCPDLSIFPCGPTKGKSSFGRNAWTFLFFFCLFVFFFKIQRGERILLIFTSFAAGFLILLWYTSARISTAPFFSFFLPHPPPLAFQLCL